MKTDFTRNQRERGSAERVVRLETVTTVGLWLVGDSLIGESADDPVGDSRARRAAIFD